jgi:hypothetical protein
VDEATVRAHAEAHGRAMAVGDVRTAGEDLEGGARDQAAEVMKAVPRAIEGATVTSVKREGDGFVVRTRYFGDGSEATVEARWQERGDRPRIVALRVV